MLLDLTHDIIIGMSVTATSTLQLALLIQNRKKKAGRLLKERLEEGSTEVGLLGQLSGKFDYIVK